MEPTAIAVVVEDDLSLAVLNRVIEASGRSFLVSRTFVAGGFGNIKRAVPRFLAASRVLPHVVLTDLDLSTCASALRKEWGVHHLPSTMLFRVAVRETEAWLMADRAGFAEFAGVALNKVPREPDALADPKQVLVNLVRRSRNRRLAVELVPAAGSRVPIGPLYNERLIQFASREWNPADAATCSPSLARTSASLKRFLIQA